MTDSILLPQLSLSGRYEDWSNQFSGIIPNPGEAIGAKLPELVSTFRETDWRKLGD
jgi:hypothetical protein